MVVDYNKSLVELTRRIDCKKVMLSAGVDVTLSDEKSTPVVCEILHGQAFVSELHVSSFPSPTIS